MSTEWDSAFGGTTGRGDAIAAKPSSQTAAPADTDFSGAFGAEQRVSEAEASGWPREAGLLSDEAAEALKLKVTESGKRLTDGLGKGAARTASVVQLLRGQGASRGRAILIRLKRERVRRSCWLVCGAIVGLAAVAAAGIEWQANRSNFPVATTGTAAVARSAMNQSAASAASTSAPVPPAAHSAIDPSLQPKSTGSAPPAVAAQPAQRSFRLGPSLTLVKHTVKMAKSKSGAKEHGPTRKDSWAKDANVELDGWFGARAKLPQEAGG